MSQLQIFAMKNNSTFSILSEISPINLEIKLLLKIIAYFCKNFQ